MVLDNGALLVIKKLYILLLMQVEALETGISDIAQWLQGGEDLLHSHQIDGEITAVEQRLEKHKVNFVLWHS